MPNPVWPVSLPEYVLAAGYQEEEPETAVRTAMETGPAKARRRFTAAPRPIKCAVRLSLAQQATLSAFYQSTLVGGSLAFDWVHPVSRAAVTMRFVGKPKYAPRTANRMDAQLDLEILP